MGTSKTWLFFEVPLQFFALRAAKRAFFCGTSLKSLLQKYSTKETLEVFEGGEANDG
jgi:hypothetical protein